MTKEKKKKTYQRFWSIYQAILLYCLNSKQMQKLKTQKL